MDRGAWQTVVHGVAKELGMTEALSTARSVQFSLIAQSCPFVPAVCILSIPVPLAFLPVTLSFPPFLLGELCCLGKRGVVLIP